MANLSSYSFAQGRHPLSRSRSRRRRRRHLIHSGLFSLGLAFAPVLSFADDFSSIF